MTIEWTRSVITELVRQFPSVLTHSILMGRSKGNNRARPEPTRFRFVLKMKEIITTIPLTNRTDNVWTRAYAARWVESMRPMKDCVTTMVPNEVTLETTLGVATRHIFLDSWAILFFKPTSFTSGVGPMSRFSRMLSSIACKSWGSKDAYISKSWWVFKKNA